MCCVTLLTLGTAGCETGHSNNANLETMMLLGQYGHARTTLNQQIEDNRRDRDYLLSRMRRAVATLADGYVQSAEPMFNEIFDELRRQGVNEDQTVTSVVFNEDLKFWKGEPYEQALAFSYTAVTYASLGQWGNARAAADNALFYLRDFGETEDGEPMTPEDLIATAEQNEDEDVFVTGYEAQPSDFALGYLLHGLASQQLDRMDEARAMYRLANRHNPALRSVTDALLAGRYNLVLIVGYGRAPQKRGIGPDSAIAGYLPRTPSDDALLQVRVDDRSMSTWPVAMDLNAMADQLKWNNLEDIRRAKSLVGDVLVYGGIGAAVYGASERNATVTLAGLGAALTGMVAKAGAHVDARHNELFPQRIYVAAAQVDDPSVPVRVMIQGKPQTAMVLHGPTKPIGQPNRPTPSQHAEVQVRYVRLVTLGERAPPWATAERLYYDPMSVDPDQELYLLGGRRLMPLSNFEQDLYRAEGVHLLADAVAEVPGLHLLEGGDSLLPPAPGTAGYSRLFATPAGAHRPQSPMLENLLQQSSEVSPQPLTWKEHIR